MKGFFCFSLNKRSPEESRVFLQTLSLENEAQIDRNNYGTMLFMSKQVSLLKLSSILQKMKIGQKFNILPFCTKPFNCYFPSQMFEASPAQIPEVSEKTFHLLFLSQAATLKPICR